jgi:hypothetical protein
VYRRSPDLRNKGRKAFVNKAKELVWAEQEVEKNGGSIISSGEDQNNPYLLFVNFRTRSGKTGVATTNLRLMPSEERIREIVQGAMSHGNS